MATQDLSYFLVKNEDIKKAVKQILVINKATNEVIAEYTGKSYTKTENNNTTIYNQYDKIIKSYSNFDYSIKENILPVDPNSQYSEQELRNISNVLKVRLSQYGLSQKILYEPINSNTYSGNYKTLESGYYKLTLSASGRSTNENFTRFIGQYRKPAVKDELLIKPCRIGFRDNRSFIWRREKEIDEGYFLLWEGTYLFANNYIVFHLEKKGFRENNKDELKKLEIKYFGLMVYPIKNQNGVEQIYVSFLDDGNIDQMNFYTNFNGVDFVKNGIVINEDFKKQRNLIDYGGRGELTNVLLFQDDKIEILDYNIGNESILKYISQLSFSVKNEDDRLVDINLIYYPNDDYGAVGGNLIFNSFNLYQEQYNLPEDGYVKLQYMGDSESVFRNIVIIPNQEIVFGNYTNKTYNPKKNENTIITPNILKVIGDEIAEIYFKIKDRTKEIDIKKSKLDDISIKDLDKFELIKLDNHRRLLKFKMPMKSKNQNIYEFNLNLETTNRDFHFALSYDTNIIDYVVISNDTEDDDIEEKNIYKKEDEDENGIYKDLKFKAGEKLNIFIHYKEDNHTVIKPLLEYYLSDCINENSVNPSNNYMQTISDFIMPARDVMLYLKTEPLYTLTVFINKEKDDNGNEIESNIESLEFNKNTYKNESEDFPLPIISKHTWGKIIDITANFKNGSKYTILDEAEIRNQYSEIAVSKRKREEDENGEENGFYIGSQSLKFNMPDRDFTLYIYEKENTYKLSFSIDEEHTIDNHGISGIILRKGNEDEKGHNFLNIGNPFNGKIEGKELSIIPGTYINVEIVYKDNEYKTYYGLDYKFVFLQIFNFNKSTITPQSKQKGKEQYITFEMPNELPNGYLDIKLKTVDLFRYILKLETFGIQSKKERPIKKAIVCYREPDPDNGYSEIVDFENLSSPREVKIEKESIIDLYIRFTDIYQHLDKMHLYGQIANPIIEEAGDFFNDIWGDDPKPQNPSDINTSNKEYFQHIRFKMPFYHTTLNLKWEERLFFIDFDIQENLINTISLSVSQKSHHPDGITAPGSSEFMAFTRFPHFTYPKVINSTNNTGAITENSIKISSSLKNGLIINNSFSFFKINNGNAIRLDTTNNFGISSVNNNSNNDISFNAFKHNIKFFLRAKYPAGFILSEINHIFNYITLLPGTYNIYFGGSKGGNGQRSTAFLDPWENNGSSGSRGQIALLTNLNIEENLTLNYFIGKAGNDGIRGNPNSDGSGPGGGGGGLSYIEFSKNVRYRNRDCKIIYCNGGKGGNGGGYADSGNLDHRPGGGGGGGGTLGNPNDVGAPWNGNGDKGGNGWNDISEGGQGGDGWDLRSKLNISMINGNDNENNSYQNVTPGNDGFLFIKSI